MTGNMETKMEEALAPSLKQMVHQVRSTIGNVGFTLFILCAKPSKNESLIVFSTCEDEGQPCTLYKP